MASINQIQLPSGSKYDLNDKRIATVGNAVAKNVATSITGSANLPTDLAVKTFVEGALTGKCDYLGTVSASTGLSSTAGKGDFYRASADFEITSGVNVHAGDIVIAEKDNPAVADYSVIHGEFTAPTVVTDGYSDTDATHAFSAKAMKDFAEVILGKSVLDTDIAIGGDASSLESNRVYFSTADKALVYKNDQNKLAKCSNAPLFFTHLLSTGNEWAIESLDGKERFNMLMADDTETGTSGQIKYINRENESRDNELRIQPGGSVTIGHRSGFGDGEYYFDNEDGCKHSWGIGIEEDYFRLEIAKNNPTHSRTNNSSVDVSHNYIKLETCNEIGGYSGYTTIEMTEDNKIDLSPASGKTADITINGDTPLDNLFTATVSDGVLTLGFGIK